MIFRQGVHKVYRIIGTNFMDVYEIFISPIKSKRIAMDKRKSLFAKMFIVVMYLGITCYSYNDVRHFA